MVKREAWDSPPLPPPPPAPSSSSQLPCVETLLWSRPSAECFVDFIPFKSEREIGFKCIPISQLRKQRLGVAAWGEELLSALCRIHSQAPLDSPPMPSLLCPHPSCHRPGVTALLGQLWAE